MSHLRVRIVLALLAAAGCAPQPASPLRIAAAADLRFALGDVVKAFRQQHPGVAIEPAYGSSGMFFTQISNHAPFDLFLSADAEYPKKLGRQGLTLPGSDFLYAEGRIVIWTANSTGIDVAKLGFDALRLPAVRHIAIANPA